MADEQSDPGEDTHWDLKYRSEEEMEFFTEMALHETQRWIEAVTRQNFHYPDDPRKSLENGVLLCELLNCLKPTSVKKINRFPTPLAGLDNVNVFLEACRNTFGLTNTQLFDSCELQDLSQRAIADKTTHLKEENDRRLRNVAVTIFFLGKSAIALNFKGPQIDPNAFAGLFEHQHVDLIPEKTSAYSSAWESKRLQSNKYFSKSDQFSGSSGIGSRYIDDDQHIGDSSYESIGSKGSDDNQSICSDGMPSTTSGIYHFGDSLSSLQQSKNFDSDIYHSSPNLYDDIRKSPASADSADAMSSSSHSCQSSGSLEGSTQRKPMQRGISVGSNDPLQFIKPKSNPLVETAQKQISLCEKNRTNRNSVSLDTEEDWYQNFASWKSRRQSKKSISALEEPDETSQVTKRSGKTFKEMVKDREKRKSFKNFNSIDDGTENNSLPASDTFQNENVSRQGDAATVSQTSISSKYENTVIKKEKSDTIEDNNKSRRSNRISGNYNNNATSNKNNNNITDNFEDDVFAANTTEEPVLKQSEMKSVESVRSLETKNDVEANNLKNIEQTARLEEKQQPLPSVESPSLVPPPPSSPPDNQGKQLLQNELPHQSKSNELHSESSSDVSSAPVERVSSPRPDKDFVERTIKISQSLKSEKGFGFLIRGGVDQNTPVVVHRIELGSAADICELRPRDMIVSINREDIQQHTQQKVQQIIDKANQHGQIELRVRRYLRGATYNEEEQNNISDKDVVVAKPILTVNSSQSVPVTEPDVTKETKIRGNYAISTRLTKTELHKTELSPEKKEVFHADIRSSPLKSSSEGRQSNSVSSPTSNMETKADLDNNNNESISAMKTTVTQSPPLINLEISEAETSNLPKATHQPHQRSASSDSALAASSLSSSPLSSSSSTSIQPPALLKRWQNSKTKNQRPSSSDMSISPKSDDTNFETELKTEATLNSTFPPRRSVNLETPPLIQTRKRSDSCDQLLFQVRDIRSYTRENENTSRNATFLPKLDNQVQLQTTTAKDQPVTENFIEKVEKNTDNFSAPLKIQIPPQIPVSTSPLQIDPKNQMPHATMNNKGSNLPEYNFNVELTYGEKVADRSSDDEGKIYSFLNNSSQLLTSPSRDGEEDEEEDEATKERKRIEEREQAALDAQKRLLEEQRMIAQERQLIEEEKKKRLQEQQQRKEAEEKKRLQEKEMLLQHEKEQLEKEKQRIEKEKQIMDEARRMLQEQKQQLEEEKKMMHRASLSGTIEKAIQQPSFSAQPLHSDSSRTTQPLSTSSHLSMTSNSKYVAPRPRTSSDVPLKSSPVQISPQKKMILTTKMESAVSHFSKNEPEPKEKQRLTREDLLAMNRKPTPLQEKPEFNSNLPHHVSPIKREPPSRTELHSLNAVPKAQHRDPKEWITPENSDVGRKPAPWSANRKSEFSPSSPSYSSSPSSSSVSKEYSQASQNRSSYTMDNVPKYNNGGLQQEGLPKESQVGSQSHWMVEKSEQRKLSDHWTEGKEQPWKGPSENRAVRPVGDRSSYSQRDPPVSRVGIKPYVYKQTSKFSPVTPAISQPTENTLKSTNYRHSYASYEDSVRPYDGLSHGYSSSNISTAGSYSTHTSNPYGNMYTKNNNSARPFQGQSGITGFQQRDNTAATKLPNTRSLTSLSSDKTEQVSVTGVEICSHCNEKLMNTASMAIETLGLYYHVKCFHCSVCHIQLGNGTEGTDVRIRHNKLHCQNCYSCSEAGLKFSKV